MDLRQRLDILLDAATAEGLMIRREPLGGDGGGYCKLKGVRVLFVDTTADIATQYERTVAALAPLEGISARYLPPVVREDLGRAGGAEANANDGGAT